MKTGKIDKHYSEILHDIFDARLESDYKECIEITIDDVTEHVKLAEEFLKIIKEFTEK